jgi:hypothetical protein
MTTLLLDGSNVALHGAPTNKLQTLSRLSEVVCGLIEHGHEPYTIFDADFRWRLPEGSSARSEFEILTKRIAEFYQLAPRGEEADLFLLESALTLEVPIISNDTFRQYGKMKGGKLSYKGEKISVYNFQVFAGVLIVPDLEIRWKIAPTGYAMRDIGAQLQARRERGDESVDSERNDQQASAKSTEPEADTSQLVTSPPELDQGKVSAIARVILRATGAGQRSISQIAGRLRDHRRTYQQSAGIGDKHKKRWFGYPALDEFIRQRLPQFRIKNGKIESLEVDKD